MKFFVTGRSSNIERVKAAFALIEAAGHEVTLKWTDFPMIKPYRDNQEKAAEFVTQQLAAIKDADIYILFAHEDGTGVFTEFGAALQLRQQTGAPKVYAIGDADVKAAAMFHYHPAIIWKDSVDEVLDDLAM